jgi:hypothetical protein
MNRALALVLAGLLAAPSHAFAAGWEHYAYPDDGFAVQAPAEPMAAKGQFKTQTGLIVPQTVYTARQADIVFQMTVGDFRGTSVDKQSAIDMAVQQLSAESEIKLNIEARIDAQFGRNLTIAGKDGSRSVAAVFFVNGKLYELVGKSLPPDPLSGSGKAVRFQESLEFIGLGAEARRPENRADGQGPGPGGPDRRGPPPQAFKDCKGKKQGDQVQHAMPGGVVPAVCVQTPQGLAARPLRALPDGPPPQAE